MAALAALTSASLILINISDLIKLDQTKMQWYPYITIHKDTHRRSLLRRVRDAVRIYIIIYSIHSSYLAQATFCSICVTRLKGHQVHQLWWQQSMNTGEWLVYIGDFYILAQWHTTLVQPWVLLLITYTKSPQNIVSWWLIYILHLLITSFFNSNRSEAV